MRRRGREGRGCGVLARATTSQGAGEIQQEDIIGAVIAAVVVVVVVVVVREKDKLVASGGWSGITHGGERGGGREIGMDYRGG